ncbi:MAG: hypothetical protein J6Q48_09750 [Bacteroidaceae bacterium]|nr:hypothetical protein [Bacteroidaceae bacterium]
MIRTYHNFKQWVNRHYPDITVTPVYGTGAYTLNKPMSPEHMYEYMVQQLPNGQYIVFPGLTAEQVAEQFTSIVKDGVPRRVTKVPSTFSSFESWLVRNNIKPLHRTHVTDISAADALHDDTLDHVKGNWYLYELEAASVKTEDITAPYVKTSSGTVAILIKTSSSGYVSKRQLFMRKFATMQPLYEQLVAAMAKEDYEQAEQLCSNYASVQFEKQLKVKDIEMMKEAYANGILSLFTRNIENFEVETSDTAF